MSRPIAAAVMQQVNSSATERAAIRMEASISTRVSPRLSFRLRPTMSSRGLTLVETLCAVAILVLLGLLVNTGLNLAMRGYRELTAQSELELLGSTLTSALADELRYAREVETEAEGSVLGDGSALHQHIAQPVIFHCHSSAPSLCRR